MNRKNGFFITLEGGEGAGKTTQIPNLVSCCKELGYETLVTRQPGGSDLSQSIRAILLDPKNKGLSPLAELMMYLADRAQHVADTIRPAIEEGKVVICDRYADSTVAYQGHARNLGVPMAKELNRVVTEGLVPDITFLFDLPVEVGLERAFKRIEYLPGMEPTEDRFEREELDFHQKVRQGFLNLAQDEPERFVIIDADRTPEEIAQNLKDVLRSRLNPVEPGQ